MVKSMESGDPQLPHLATFAKAAELCSFTAAANELHLTQAAVSQRIQALEKTLNKNLFHRQGGRVSLTEAGRKLYDFSQQILELHREARQEVTGQETPIKRELALAASSIPGEHLLPRVLSGFRQQHPHVQVRATVSDSMAVMKQVERGEVSLGLVGRKTDNPQLEFRYLANDRMVLIVPPQHALARRKRISLHQLTQYPLILREVGSGIRHCLEKSLEKAGHSLNDFQIALELGSNEAIKEAVLRGMGVALLSVYAVQKELQSGELLAVKVADLHCDREMFVVRDTRRVLPNPARLFLHFLEAHPISTSTP
jgi:DNA-binding transcriptional LysR family regulator